MRIASLFVVVAAVACQSGSSAPGAAKGSAAGGGAAGPSVMAALSRAEADSLCNAYERSGAAADDGANRDYLVATWLGKEIVSDTGRGWLVGFNQLGADKAARRTALAQAAKDVGLADCPLISMWQ